MLMLYSLFPSTSDVKTCRLTVGSSKSPIVCSSKSFFAGAFFTLAVAMLLMAVSTTLSAPAGILSTGAPPSTAPAPSAQILGLPMQFEKNAGQTDSQVEFLARGPGYGLFLTSTQAVFSLSPLKRSAADQKYPERKP